MPLIMPEAKVLLDALGRGRRRRAEKMGAKLDTVRPVVDPPPARLHELAGANGRRAPRWRGGSTLGGGGGVCFDPGSMEHRAI